MTLADRIFPTGPPRDGYILRVESASSWESQFVGLGRLTAFLTPRLLEESHAVDDMGINLVFLQRHRVEVGLKLVLERSTAVILNHHRLRRLMIACESACEAVGFGTQWTTFAAKEQEYVDLMDQVDPGAATWRYPVDTKAAVWPRLPHVDLVELEQAGREFEGDVQRLIEALAALEPVPIGAADAEAAATELRELIRGSREMMAFSESAVRAIRRETERFRFRRHGRPSGAEEKLAPLQEVSDSLAARAQAMLDRIIDAYGLRLPDEPARASASPIPMVDPLDGPEAVAQWQTDYIKWFVDEFVKRARPLTQAVAEVEKRSEDWSMPAARQVYLDTTRFRSRLVNAMRLQDPAA